MDLESIYKDRISKFQEEEKALSKQISFISYLRFALFISVFIALYFLLAHSVDIMAYVAFVLLIAFLWIIKIHEKRHRKLKIIQNISQQNLDEIQSIKGNWKAFDGGESFLDNSQIHTADLDVFGDDSLFQKINRTATLAGRNKLAEWFRFPNRDADKILATQKIIGELKNDLDFRQNFRALASQEEELSGDYVKMIKWMKQKPYFSENLLFSALNIIIPLSNITVTTLWIMGILSYLMPLISILLSLAFLSFFQKKIISIHNVLSRRAKLLNKYVDLLQCVENKEFTSSELQRIQKEMQGHRKKAFEHIHDLVHILQRLDQRLNMLMGILLNVYLMWDFRNLAQMERWKKENAYNMMLWFKGLGLIDAYCSLANLAYNEPLWVFPKLDDATLLEGEEMRHPLMQYEQCVPNDIHIQQRPHFKIITGANMAGKSTYLRTVGANYLLAMMGSVVNAKSFQFSPAYIATSLRTTDSLMKNESYFYAELKRLQGIIQKLKKGKKVLILLDEILKGTNSKDKEEGSIKLLEQLIELQSFGIIATHDLNLAKIASSYSKYTENFRFEAEIIEDKLFFDYRLRAGVAQNLNATFLMKKMGIVKE